ncbi:ABC transporter substrate-binding protein [Pseudonocardia xishanensis]|uniref:Iron(III) transport system substrate-binding protein n=1 Tax=Pseudonocardia xishanensis TaxID=630995 RepID=A0ABP8RUE2_9PSEU
MTIQGDDRRGWRRAPLVALAAVAAVVLAGCGGGGGEQMVGDAAGLGPAGEQQFVDLYRAAQEAGEREVVVYSSFSEPLKPAFDAFSKRFPDIKVTGVPLFGAPLQTKVEQEVTSGRVTGDFVASAVTSMSYLDKAGRFEPYRPFAANSVTNDLFVDPAYPGLTGFMYDARGFLYNTTQVPEGSAPQGWKDLLDPAWKGRLGITDPTSNGAGLSSLYQLTASGQFDDAYLRGLADQQLQLSSSSPELSSAVATGRVPVGLSVSNVDYQRLKKGGAPVGFQFPLTSGGYVASVYGALTAGAPHPNAAKLLFNWLYTPEGAQALADLDYFSPVPGSPTPDGYPPIEQIPTLTPPGLAEQATGEQQVLPEIKQVFGKA